MAENQNRTRALKKVKSFCRQTDRPDAACLRLAGRPDLPRPLFCETFVSKQNMYCSVFVTTREKTSSRAGGTRVSQLVRAPAFDRRGCWMREEARHGPWRSTSSTQRTNTEGGLGFWNPLDRRRADLSRHEGRFYV